MDEEGGQPGDVKLGVGGRVGVRHEHATADIIPGVQQIPNVGAGSDEGVAKIEISEFITPLSWRQHMEREKKQGDGGRQHTGSLGERWHRQRPSSVTHFP